MKPVSDKELELLSHKDIVRFAVFCAEQMRDSWENIPECVVAIETVERWLKGKAAEEECVNAAYTASAAANAAYAAAVAANAAYTAAVAAYSAAYADAAHAAVHATSAAYYATSAAADGKSHLIEAQRNYYLELLHFDDIAEKLLLGATI